MIQTGKAWPIWVVFGGSHARFCQEHATNVGACDPHVRVALDNYEGAGSEVGETNTNCVRSSVPSDAFLFFPCLDLNVIPCLFKVHVVSSCDIYPILHHLDIGKFLN